MNEVSITEMVLQIALLLPTDFLVVNSLVWLCDLHK